MKEIKDGVVCPKCGSGEKVIPIIYRCSGGDYERYRALEKEGKVLMAGCVISVDTPKYFCKGCRLNIWESDL